jgi:hypothetical protein
MATAQLGAKDLSSSSISPGHRREAQGLRGGFAVWREFPIRDCTDISKQFYLGKYF